HTPSFAPHSCPLTSLPSFPTRRSSDLLHFASDYFEQLYDWAEHLIGTGKAFVDDQTQDQIRETRGTLTEPGRNSPFRDRSTDERDRKSTRLNSSHDQISYAVFCLKKKK